MDDLPFNLQDNEDGDPLQEYAEEEPSVWEINEKIDKVVEEMRKSEDRTRDLIERLFKVKLKFLISRANIRSTANCLPSYMVRLSNK